MEAGLTILVVDDDPAILVSLCELLEAEGYATARAQDGAEALEYLRAGNRPALILLDVFMPTMDGRTFRRVQKQDAALADIPVILLTGGEAQSLQSLHSEIVLHKPCSPATVLTMVRAFTTPET